MNIRLINTYSTDNLGDAAIYQALVNLSQPLKVVASSQLNDTGAVTGLTLDDTEHADDIRVSVGGDIFNNARPQFITRKFLENLRSLRARADRTILFGQSIPRSCRGMSFGLLSASLRSLGGVMVRDEESFSRLKASGVKCRLGFDTAFSLTLNPLALEAAKRRLSEASRGKPSALLTIRAFNDNMYDVEESDFIDQTRQFISELQQHGYCTFLLKQSRVDHSDDDQRVITSLSSVGGGLEVIDPWQWSEQWSALEIAMAINAAADLVVGTRFHTNIFRLIGGRKPFVIDYSNKGSDLIKRFELDGVRAGQMNPVECANLAIKNANEPIDVQHYADIVKRDFQELLTSVEPSLMADRELNEDLLTQNFR